MNEGYFVYHSYNINILLLTTILRMRDLQHLDESCTFLGKLSKLVFPLGNDGIVQIVQLSKNLFLKVSELP